MKGCRVGCVHRAVKGDRTKRNQEPSAAHADPPHLLLRLLDHLGGADEHDAGAVLEGQLAQVLVVL